jgi:hypothetical protein
MDHITNANASQETRTERKAYETPTLTDFGSVAEITQGASGTAAVDNAVYS